MSPHLDTRELIQGAICATCTLVLIILLFHHYSTSRRAFHTPDSDLTFKYDSVLCSFLLIFIGILLCGFAVYEAIHVIFIYITISPNFCQFIVIFFISIYPIYKLAMYYALISRASEVFKDSSRYYTCSKNFYLFWKLFVLFTLISFIVTGNIFIKMDQEQITFGKCRGIVPTLYIAATVIVDAIICTINLYVFIKPLWILSKNVSTQTKDMPNGLASVYRNLITKNALLASISVITSIIVWIAMGVFQNILHVPVVWEAIDTVISSMCIVLLFKWNESSFNILCCYGCKKNIKEKTMEMIHAAQMQKQKTRNIETGSMSDPECDKSQSLIEP